MVYPTDFKIDFRYSAIPVPIAQSRPAVYQRELCPCVMSLREAFAKTGKIKKDYRTGLIYR